MLNKPDMTGWEGRTNWCGPSALAVLTGMSLASAHSRLAFVQDLSLEDVSSAHVSELMVELYSAGFNSTPIPIWERHKEAPLLRNMMKSMTGYEKCTPVLMLLQRPNSKFSHFVCSHYGMFMDAHTGFKPVCLEDYKFKSTRVVAARVIEKRKV